MAQASSLSRGASSWYWAIISVVGWLVLSPLAAWLGSQAADLLAPAALETAPTVASTQLRSAVMHGGWALFGVAAVLAGRTLAFGMSARLRSAWIAWLAAGICVALVLDLTLLAWGYGRFGTQAADPELLGATRWLPALLIVVAVSRFGTHVAPSGRARLPVAVLALSAVLAVLVIVANLPGLADGLGGDSVALAGVMTACVVYLVAVVAAAVRGRRDLWGLRRRG